MNSEQFKDYCDVAFHDLERLNEGLELKFGIGKWERWDCDLQPATLTFSNDGMPKVIANVQVAGSTSNKSGTWMWGWANQHLPAQVTEEVSRVGEFGKRENISQLTDATFSADEEVGWQMAAVATKVLQGKGVYRCPSKAGFLFLILMNVSFVESDSRNE
jgi:hypothetical protein